MKLETQRPAKKALLCWTAAAAAAVGSTTTTISTHLPLLPAALCAVAALRTADAFAVVPQHQHRLQQLQLSTLQPYRHQQQHQMRSYASFKRDDSGSGGGGGGGGGFLEKVGRAVKNLLPSSWFENKNSIEEQEQKRRALERKRVETELSGGLSEILKDAPLPIRLFGNMISPFFSTVMSTLAESVAEQQATVDSLLRDAKGFLEADDAVVRLLGEPIQVGSPFSQSSSTSSINGQTTQRIELAFSVTGPFASAVARLTSNGNGNIQQLVLQYNGRVVTVSTDKVRGIASKAKRWSGGSSTNNDDTIIEAEIIEKKKK